VRLLIRRDYDTIYARDQWCIGGGIRGYTAYTNFRGFFWQRILTSVIINKQGTFRPFAIRRFRIPTSIFTARCYASAVLAMALCPSVRPSVTSRCSYLTLPYLLTFVPYDVISGVIARLQKVYPHFSVMPHGLVHESEEKLRAHFLHTGTPSATGLLWQARQWEPTRWRHGWVLFLSRPRSEGWPHHGRTFSIYPCPLSFWLTLPRLSAHCLSRIASD